MKYLSAAILLLVCLVATVAEAVPPARPGLVDSLTGQFRTTGQPVPVFPKSFSRGRVSPEGGKFPLSLGVFGARKTAAVRPMAIDPSRDNVVRPLVLLVEFADRPHAPLADNAAIETLVFGAGLSVANYWGEVSYGRFAIGRPSLDNAANPDVVGWLQAVPQGTPGSPGTFPSSVTTAAGIAGVQVGNIRTLINDVVAFLTAGGFDFSPYVRASDNTLAAVILVHPGTGAEDTGDLTFDPYSHTAEVDPIAAGPGFIVDYTIIPSRQFYSDPTPRNLGTETDPDPTDDPLIGIGVIVHEMGHLLGLPDLYPTATAGQTAGGYSAVGVYDLMGYGLWGAPGLARAENPAHLSAWSKMQLGWLTPTILSKTRTGAINPPRPSLPPAETSAQAFKIYPNGPGDESQFFLAENRSDVPAALFDKGLPFAPGSPPGGVLIWRVDNERFDAWRQSSPDPLRRGNTVNNDNVFLALAVMEADLDNTAAGRVPDLIQPFGIGPRAFGDAGDFWSTPGHAFTRTSPVDGPNETNSAPILNLASARHSSDSGFMLTLANFVRSALDFLFDLFVELPYWKVFRSTDPQPTLDSNRVLSYGFDSSNRTWIGTADRGVWINVLSTWRQINTFRSPRVQAMAFEPRTGGMWVGTDNSVEKVRLDSIVASFPDVTQFPGFPSLDVRAIQIDRASRKWVGGQLGTTGRGGLAVIFDPGNNLPSDFAGNFSTDLSFRFSPAMGPGEVITALAYDNVFSPVAATDVLYVGTSLGRIYRNADASGNVRDLFASNIFNVGTVLFEPIAVPPNAPSPTVVHALGIDKVGILWAATDRGVFAFDRGDPAAVPSSLPDLFNPFDLAGDNTITSLAYFPASFTSPGIVPTGIAFQDTGQPRSAVWVSYGDPATASELATGGAERIDPNALINTAIPRDPAPGINPADAERIGHAIMPFHQAVPAGPAVGALRDLIGAAGDGTATVWFATKVSGAVRFGSGAILTLDKSIYINESAIATIQLLDENAVSTSQSVTVASGADSTGFPLVVQRGTDNVYRGSFGFSKGGTDNVARKIGVTNGTAVTITYRDSNPPSVKTATATWKDVVPFEDDLWVGSLCFVATAAYGSGMAPEVNTLRFFRDRFLMRNPAGRAFVSVYYRLSPPLAAAIARSPVLRGAARFALAPAVLSASFAVGAGGLEIRAVAALMGAASFLLIVYGRRGGRRSPGLGGRRRTARP